MFFSPRSVTVCLATLLIPISANAAPLCEYAAYSVPALHQNILAALGHRGLAVAPAAYFSTSDTDANGLDEEFWVLEDGQLYAKLRFSEKSVEASSEIRITDAIGNFLAEAKSTVMPCSGGWCRETKLTTAIDASSDSTNGSGGLVISQEPSYGMRYVVYGEAVRATSWRTQFDERYEWILNVLSDREQALPLQTFTQMQRFMVAMASKPALTPFLNQINVTVARDGHFIVKGRVTHAAYNAMIDAAFDLGFYNIEPLVVIDSAAGSDRYMDRDLGRCLGRG